MSTENNFLENVKTFFENHPLLKQLAYITLFLIGAIVVTLLWLHFYTNHGEKIPMENFVDMDVREAHKLAKKKSFNMVIADSTFIVGKPGGVVVMQNPKAKAEVKTGRKVYVTITKFDPDKIKVSELPILYGNDFNQKMAELGYKGLKCKIKSKKFDRGETNHILEVYYKGKLIIDQNTVESNVSINKGDALEFVVSEREGGEFTIPKLTCLTLDEAEFLLASQELLLGEVSEKGSITERGSAYVLIQEPVFDGNSKILMGSKINVTIAQGKPLSCK